MTTAPADLKVVQQYAHDITGQDWNSLGIIHTQPQGGGYHEGQDLLALANRAPGPSYAYSDYSYADARAVSSNGIGRDLANSTTLAGDPNAASAFDFGGGFARFHEFSNWLVGRCVARDPRAGDIREVIYTPDGSVVRRWDATGRQPNSGDSTHLSHTHISFFRDSNGRRDRMDNFLGLLKEFFEGITQPPAQQEDDDMGASFGPLEIPVTGRGSFNIPPVQAGSADPRPAWLNIGNSLEGASSYGLRIAAFTDAGPVSANVGSQVGTDAFNRRLNSNTRYSFTLPKGTYLLEISRISADGTAAPYDGHLTFCVERGPVSA